MSFERDGFLTAHMPQQIAEIRRHYAKWFGLAEELNRIGQRIVLAQRLLESNRGFGNYRAVALLFYTRALSSFQAVILLTERGMIVEANTLIRGLIETAAVLAGLHKDKDAFVKRLAAADYFERKASGNWLTNNPSVTQHVSAKNMAKLRKFIAKLERSNTPLNKLIISNVAAETRLSELYAIYRHLSHHYAHPSVTAVSIFTSRGPGRDGLNISWNNEYGLRHIGDTMGYACTTMIGASLAINETVPTDNIAQELTNAFRTYRTLALASERKIKRTRPAMRRNVR